MTAELICVRSHSVVLGDSHHPDGESGSDRLCIVERLQKVCRYAYEKAPFYKKKWDEAGFHPDQISSLEDFESKCPVITKADLRKAQERTEPSLELT